MASIHIFVHICLYMYTKHFTYMVPYIRWEHIYTNVRVCEYIHVYICVCVYIYIYICICMYMKIYVYIHVYVYICE